MAKFSIAASLSGVGSLAMKHAPRAKIGDASMIPYRTDSDTESDDDDDMVDAFLEALAEKCNTTPGRLLCMFSKNVEELAALREEGARVRFVESSALTTEVKSVVFNSSVTSKTLTFHTSDLGYFVPELLMVADGEGSNDADALARVNVAGHQPNDEDFPIGAVGLRLTWARAVNQSQVFTITAPGATDTAPIRVHLFANGGLPDPEEIRGLTRGFRELKGKSGARKLRTLLAHSGAKGVLERTGGLRRRR